MDCKREEPRGTVRAWGGDVERTVEEPAPVEPEALSEEEGEDEEPTNIFEDCETVHSVMGAFAGFCVALARDKEATDEDLANALDHAMVRMMDIMNLEPDEFGYEWNAETQTWEA